MRAVNVIEAGYYSSATGGSELLARYFPYVSDESRATKTFAQQQSGVQSSNAPRLLPGNVGVIVDGWVILASNGHILSARDSDSVAKAVKMNSLPEMTYGRNQLHLHHVASGISIYFTAIDALLGCAFSDGERQVQFQVDVAEQWTQSRSTTDIQKIELPYDWTFCSRYSGTVALRQSLGTGPDLNVSSYFNLLQAASAYYEQLIENLEAAGFFHKDTDYDIPHDLIKTVQPITWFQDVVLFEDELHDHGQAHMSVKVRVMPDYFLVLARMWMRLDGVVVRIRDARYFYQFGTSVLLKEVTWRERKFGSASETAGFKDPSQFYLSLPIVKSEKHHFDLRKRQNAV